MCIRYPFRLCVMLTVALLLIGGFQAKAAAGPETPKEKPKKQEIEPTFGDVAYGPDEDNRLDFWKAPSDKPTPVIVEIHGGGFYEGGKHGFRRDVDDITRCMDAGVSLASIDYRFIGKAPLYDILRDCARAIQFIRYKAPEWNVDRTHIATFGESAGAGTSLWLAFHDDLADPNSPDPVLRESTRLVAAGAQSTQATYDFTQWPEILHLPQYVWYSSSIRISPAYYHMSFLGPYTEKGRKMRADLDIVSWADPKDPPVYLISKQLDTDMNYTNLGRLVGSWMTQKLASYKLIKADKIPKDLQFNFDILHHPLHTRRVEEVCNKVGIPCKAIYRDTPQAERCSVYDFLLPYVLGQK